MDLESIRRDFDRIARLDTRSGGGSARYDAFLLSLVPAAARSVLDVGCGTGRLTAKLADAGLRVTGIDLSPEMIERARAVTVAAPGVELICGDFLSVELTSQEYDCVITSATLHHMDLTAAVRRMSDALRPGGRLILHDLRTTAHVADAARAWLALSWEALMRLATTGRPLSPVAVRRAWQEHAAAETYLTPDQVRTFAERHLPGSRVYLHSLWRYTVVWDRPATAESR